MRYASVSLVFLTMLAAGVFPYNDAAELKEIKRFPKKVLYAYLLPNQDMTGRESKLACDGEGLKLASIDNQEENDAIGSYLRQRVRGGEDNNRGWLGGSDTGMENRWYWMHSKKRMTFTNWAPGHPIKSNLYNCVYMAPPNKDRNGLWYSQFCTEVAQGIPICQHLL